MDESDVLDFLKMEMILLNGFTDKVCGILKQGKCIEIINNLKHKKR